LRVRICGTRAKAIVTFPDAIAERVDAWSARANARAALPFGDTGAEAKLARLAFAARKAAVAAATDTLTARRGVACARGGAVDRRIDRRQQRCIGIIFADLVLRLAAEEAEHEQD
jgi:hypothetical protein